MTGSFLAGGKVAEVIRCSSANFTAQCYNLYEAPDLGSFVRVGQEPIFGIIHNILNEALDPGRRILPLGFQEELEGSIYSNNPQLARLLSTQIDVVIVGYLHRENMRQTLPPSPPRIHAFVYRCSDLEVSLFTRDLTFLHLLARSSALNIDEVIASALRISAPYQEDPRLFLQQAGSFLANEMANDIPRLQGILRGITR